MELTMRHGDGVDVPRRSPQVTIDGTPQRAICVPSGARNVAIQGRNRTMTNQQRHLLESMYPNCFDVQRSQNALQRSSHYHDKFERLEKMIDELSDDCLYTLHDCDFFDVWICTYQIEKRTPKRVYICLHEKHNVRNLTWERLALNRHELEAAGRVWHHGSCQTFLASQLIEPILVKQQNHAADSIMAYYHQYHEMQRNYGERGVALTDEELRIATQLVGDIIDEEMEAYLRPTCTTTHNWLEEGF